MQNSGKKTNERILEAAVAVFARKGYNAATTKEIAAEAGVSEGSVFKYYKTKRDILLKAMDRVVELVLDEKTLKPFEKIISSNDNARPEAVLKAMVLDREAFFKENSELMKIMFTEALYNKEILARFYEAFVSRGASVLMGFLERGEREGVFRHMDERRKMIALRMFISVTAGYILLRDLMPGPPESGGEGDSDIDLMLDILLKGLLK